MVFQDGYFYQGRLFYSTKWTRPMEATFVDALVEHKKQGHFKRNGINFHAVMCAIYDVNREHATKHSYATGDNKLRKLKERYSIFSTILKMEGVLVNSVGRYVLADDTTWEKMIKVTKLKGCCANVTLMRMRISTRVYASCSVLIPLTSQTYLLVPFFLEEYYASDDEEEVNSILALPAAPPPSPDPSYVSVEHISSSASNEISKSN
ncbi:hypothetical protein Salat_2740300 [Sesamum alatum]|uniref:Myb/SANT-like domain-containing protein n=1 Tax=Sesamum alatum TaxID=300844 RepID=A0AAE1XKV0_9LAMI|nr:hypothetical protein Salat_2740300 [Sesamum alatum]